jgi:diacylglycerol kinase (CTP)
MQENTLTLDADTHVYSMPLKARNDIHLARRFWHFCGVMMIALLYRLVPPEKASLTAVAMMLLICAVDIGRLKIPRLNRTMTWLFKPFLRESERHRLAGVTFMMIGVTFVILFCPRNVVYLTLFCLGVADPLASYFGIRYGRDKLVGEKSLQGSLAAFVACFLLSVGYFYFMNLMHERLFIVALLAGLIGAVSELVPVGPLDDNLVFPVLSGTLLTGVFYLFGGL